MKKTPDITKSFEDLYTQYRQRFVVIARRYVRNSMVPDNRPFVALGTDGYGRSDTRAKLRSYFGVDAAHIVVATLKKLADEGEVDARLVKDAISSFELDTDRPVAWAPQATPELHAVADYKEEN